MRTASKLILIGTFTLIFVGALLNSASVFSYPGGVKDLSQLGCSPCHGGDPSTNTTVTIYGLPLFYEPGMDYALTVEVVSTDVPGNDGGFDLSVTGGTLVVTDTTSTQLMNGDLTQTDFGWNQRSWPFNWTAPSADGDVTFFVAGLAADGNGGITGDAWAKGSLTISIIPEFTTITLVLALAVVTIAVIVLTRKRLVRLQR